jgi:hypothetical protein
MAHVLRIETCGTALDGNFAHEAGLHEIAQIVVSGSPREAWIKAIDSLKYFRGGGMAVVLYQE